MHSELLCMYDVLVCSLLLSNWTEMLKSVIRKKSLISSSLKRHVHICVHTSVCARVCVHACVCVCVCVCVWYVYILSDTD